MKTPSSAENRLGWGAKRIAAEMGCSRNTVRRYLRQGDWQPYRAPPRARQLSAHADWLAERFRQHRGNCDVVRQELQREFGITVSLRTVERAVVHLRREIVAQSVATVRFDTPPGHQLQIDFGTVRVPVGDEPVKVHLFVATLGYSRRTYVAMFLHERQSAWLQGLEGAFRHFGGLTRELLLDNARALVDDQDAQTREVSFNDRFHAFCRYWDVVPRACAPYRARGAVHAHVGHLAHPARQVRLEFPPATRSGGRQWRCASRIPRRARPCPWSTGEPPIQRFEREERAALKPLPARAPFLQVRELSRRVHSDACIELDTNRYSVPWKFIGESVTVVVAERQVRVLYAGQEVACHAQSPCGARR